MFWVNKDDSTNEVVSTLAYEKHERCRFRVEEEIWNDLAASEEAREDIALFAMNYSGNYVKDDAVAKEREEAKQNPAWRLIVSMAQQGLGMTNWW